MSARPALRRALAIGAATLTLSLAVSALAPARPYALLGRTFTLSAPAWLHLVALWPVLAGIAHWSRAALSPGRLGTALALRGLAIAMIALALAEPVELADSHRTSTVIAVDVSDSIDARSLAAARSYVARAIGARADAHLALVTFARTPRRVDAPSPQAITRHSGERESDLERALSLAVGLLEPEAIGQVVLLSDGRETHGELLRGAATLAARGVQLFAAPAARATPPEVGIRKLALPDELRAGEPFALRATLTSNTACTVRVTLLRDGLPDPREPARTLHLEAGDTELSFHGLVERAGSITQRLAITPLEGCDQHVENNAFEHTAEVRGGPRVLLVAREPEHADAATSLLRGAGFAVDVRDPGSLPHDPIALADYAFYVLADLPDDALPRATVDALAHQLREGAGLLRTGGEHAFQERARPSPLAALSPVLPVAALTEDTPSLALVLAIDKSGSMAGDKLSRAKEAAIATAALLGPRDYLGVLGFDTEPEWVVKSALATQRSRIARGVERLSASGGTALFPALDAAYTELSAIRARVKHVVALTDGQTEEESLAALARSMRDDGITISAIGLGDDVQHGRLSELAELGGGRAFFTRDPARIPRLFADEAELVAHPTTVEQRVHVRALSAPAFLRGISIDRAPPLRGYVETRMRVAPAESIFATERGAPVLARMRVGLGWSLALTTDLAPRWAIDWLRWPPFGKLLAQLVREHMRRDTRDAPRLEIRENGDEVVAAIDALDERERFVNGLTGTLTATRADAHGARAPFAQVAPGRYEARLALPDLGSYRLRAQLSGEHTTLRTLGAYDRPFPAEFRAPFGPDEKLLARAAAVARGGSPPPPESLHEARGRAAKRRVPRWAPLLWLSLSLFVLDVTARRLPRRAPATRVGA